MNQDWPTESWVRQVVSRAVDDHPMYWNESDIVEGECNRCHERRPLANVIYHEQMRGLCKPCTYLVLEKGLAEWPE